MGHFGPNIIVRPWWSRCTLKIFLNFVQWMEPKSIRNLYLVILEGVNGFFVDLKMLVCQNSGSALKFHERSAAGRFSFLRPNQRVARLHIFFQFRTSKCFWDLEIIYFCGQCYERVFRICTKFFVGQIFFSRHMEIPRKSNKRG